jgi:hypothetical protein
MRFHGYWRVASGVLQRASSRSAAHIRPTITIAFKAYYGTDDCIIGPQRGLTASLLLLPMPAWFACNSRGLYWSGCRRDVKPRTFRVHGKLHIRSSLNRSVSFRSRANTHLRVWFIAPKDGTYLEANSLIERRAAPAFLAVLSTTPSHCSPCGTQATFLIKTDPFERTPCHNS